jgi:Transcriptional regulator
MDREKKEEIVRIVVEMLSEENIHSITTRRIADRAKINPAMVNYYFGSKKELLKEAMVKSSQIDVISTEKKDPRKAMFDLLMNMCEKILTLSRFEDAYFSDIIQRDSKAIRHEVHMQIKLYFKDQGRDDKYGSMAYRIVGFLMLASSDFESYYRYMGVDIRNKNALRNLISSQLDEILGNPL